MKVSIIASHENLGIAKEFLTPLSGINLMREFTDDSPYPRTLIKRKMLISDVILLIIDEKFEDNSYLNYTSKIASIVAKEESNITLLPIVLNNAKVPESILEWANISCDTSSAKDIARVKHIIGRDISHNRNNNSFNKKTQKNASLITLTIAIELFASLFIVLFALTPKLDVFEHFYDSSTVGLIGILTILLAFLSLVLSYFSIIKRRSTEDTNNEIESYSKRLKKAMVTEAIDPDNDTNDEKNEIDALGRMLINLEDIKEFYTWSQKQAKAAFYLAICMCVLGFLLMATSVVLLMVFDLSIHASLLPTIGGIVTEVIAGTALIVYKHSLLQLNHYHKALHEDERFLSSVNLINKFNSPDVQDEMLREIIRSEIQMNLSSQDIPREIKTINNKPK